VPDGKILLLFEVGERAIAPCWRCLARSTNTPGIDLGRIKGKHSLQADLVLPEGVKIIFIQEAFFDPEMQGIEPDLLWVIAKPETTISGHAICLAMNEETVQMGVIPAHHDLEGVMEIGQALVTRHQHAPPDGSCLL
jgi:hypothetical protein